MPVGTRRNPRASPDPEIPLQRRVRKNVVQAPVDPISSQFGSKASTGPTGRTHGTRRDSVNNNAREPRRLAATAASSRTSLSTGVLASRSAGTMQPRVRTSFSATPSLRSQRFPSKSVRSAPRMSGLADRMRASKRKREQLVEDRQMARRLQLEDEQELQEHGRRTSGRHLEEQRVSGHWNMPEYPRMPDHLQSRESFHSIPHRLDHHVATEPRRVTDRHGTPPFLRVPEH